MYLGSPDKFLFFSKLYINLEKKLFLSFLFSFSLESMQVELTYNRKVVTSVVSKGRCDALITA